ncbi:hypothetical protein SUGI_0299990 [Cryptomeria japonica]|uniref:DNA-directed RNA polymerases IV and V subunit 2 isoform X2 n=1 Tax=Cryptomeria japonica TaxID=3369 RepID=UPI002408E22F|nr:DNA-directed RNA polymerases IV and V subunit 2 isoform X2 [Cryptomeria japonica]GLJ17285.1 hypothetical protein SUGI_0299990 [Cryptomeria japonica]
MSRANEIELSEKMDIIEISDESDDSASNNNDIATIAEEIEDSATDRDISKVANGCEIDEDVLYRAEKADDDPFKLGLGDAAKEIEDLFTSMDIDNAGEVEEVPSDIDLTTVAEEIESSDDEPDVTKGSDNGLSDTELCTFVRDTTKAFFDEYGLVSHQINSFNDFMTHGLQKVFDNVGEIEVESEHNPQKRTLDVRWNRASISFGRVTVEKPSYCNKEGKLLPLKPAEARLRNMTYSSPVHVEMTTKETNDKSKSSSSSFTKNAEVQKKTVPVGRIPIMVKSQLCYLSSLNSKDLLKEADCMFDVGGYFIIKGHEKVFIAQEERCTNRIWISSTPSWMAIYTPHSSGFTWKKNRVIVKVMKTSKDDKWFAGREVITVSFSSITVPVVLMFYALGVESDFEMMQMIDNALSDSKMSEILMSSIYKAEAELKDFRKKDKVWEYINDQLKKSKFSKSQDIEEVLKAHVFPYIVGYKQKAMFLGYMVNCLLSAYFGKRHVENKDDYKNKRLELAGELLGRELQGLVRHFCNRLRKGIQRELSVRGNLESMDIYNDASIITNGLVRAFSTGNWSHPHKFNIKCTGVVANLKSTNPLQTLSEMRRMRLRVQYAAKLGDARYPNPSYWGRVCFISTPDGENCGLVKNLAVTCLVSLNTSEKPVLDALKQYGIIRVDQLSLSDSKDATKVFVNGEWVGIHHNSDSLVKKLKDLRRKQRIHPQVEIKNDDRQNEIRIFTDAGRVLRPLLIVKNKRLCIFRQQFENFKKSCNPFKYLMKRGIIEILGVEEEEDSQIACGINILRMAEKNTDYVQFTHCELDPSFLLSLNASLIPFANRNLATRTLFQSEKHSRQAIGYYTTNSRTRCDTSSHQLFYPQKTLFKTMSSDCLKKVELYNGQNAIVAVNVHYGYNQEDSLVLNHASIDRGLFRTMHFHTFTSETDHDDSESKNSSRIGVDFGKPSTENLRVDKLDDDGLPYIGSDLYSGDVLIGKVSSQPSDANFSLKLKHTERGRVDQVIMANNDDGRRFARVRLREARTPSLGDKFSSMHGQKGVIGFIEEQENMPFTIEGIVPDLIINPHAFPSRQTPGQLFECALSKIIASSGIVGDATPFSPITIESITEQLHRYGYEQWGKEQMYNGRTGYKLRSKIFIGPTYYQRLIHMSEDKLKYRNHGPVHPLTRQPVADRKRHGGVKFGEMERDCMLAHGATANLLERLFYLSDFSSMHICSQCHMVATVILKEGIRGPYCPFCKTAKYAVKVNVPYACKLLYQELFSMGICLKFLTELC